MGSKQMKSVSPIQPSAEVVWATGKRILVAGMAVVVAGNICAFAKSDIQSNYPDNLLIAQAPNNSKTSGADQANFVKESEGILVQCRSLFKQREYKTIESLCKKELPAVRKYGQNDTVLPKYLGVIGSCCYFQKRYKEAISFLQEALKVNDGLPAKKRITDNALFGVHSYFAMSLQEIEKYPQASEHFLRAIHIADNLPPGQIDQTWLKLCYQGLIYCLRRQGKYEDVLKFKERMAKLGLK